MPFLKVQDQVTYIQLQHCPASKLVPCRLRRYELENQAYSCSGSPVVVKGEPLQGTRKTRNWAKKEFTRQKCRRRQITSNHITYSTVFLWHICWFWFNLMSILPIALSLSKLYIQSAALWKPTKSTSSSCDLRVALFVLWDSNSNDTIAINQTNQTMICSFFQMPILCMMCGASVHPIMSINYSKVKACFGRGCGQSFQDHDIMDLGPIWHSSLKTTSSLLPLGTPHSPGS